MTIDIPHTLPANDVSPSGSFDLEEMASMQATMKEACRILSDRGVCGVDKGAIADERSFLASLVVAVFAEGERDKAAAVEKCVARYRPTGVSRLRFMASAGG